jgi:hypothetical protein
MGDGRELGMEDRENSSAKLMQPSLASGEPIDSH